MQVIPVIDLLGGVVVRGIAGRREEYRPIVSQIAADPQPVTVARALVERFGFDTFYVADLDAIAGRKPNGLAWEAIGNFDEVRGGDWYRLWLDAGVGDHKSFWRTSELAMMVHVIIADIVVGLESLNRRSNWHLVKEIKEYHTPIFSLDLMNGVPLTQVAQWKNLPPLEIARALKADGVEHFIVLDLADVGVANGTHTLDLCRQLCTELGAIHLIAGGGVRGLDDLKALADAGCDAALVASALHDGRLTRDDIERAKEFGRAAR